MDSEREERKLPTTILVWLAGWMEVKKKMRANTARRTSLGKNMMVHIFIYLEFELKITI